MIHLTEEELAALREKVKGKVIQTKCTFFLNFQEFMEELEKETPNLGGPEEPPMHQKDNTEQLTEEEKRVIELLESGNKEQLRKEGYIITECDFSNKILEQIIEKDKGSPIPLTICHFPDRIII